MIDSDRRHLTAYIAAAAVLIVIAVRTVGCGAGSDRAPSISMAAPAPAQPAGVQPRAARPAGAQPGPARPPVQELVWVDVAGAVRRPGLYSLPKGARVAAAIERAGGVRRRANRAAVNLAARLGDGQQIFVPAGGAAGVAATGAPVAGAAGTSGTTPGAGAASGPAARISLSTATQAQLEELDGIGPALAQRIIQYREQHGGFRSVDQLQEVSGIGEKRMQALKGSIEP